MRENEVGMSRKKVLAIILAGGEGGRLEVLTEERAKPAVPFAGVYRLIDFALSNCMHSGISDVWVIEQYRPHSLNEHLANGRPWDLDRTYGGLQVLPPYEVRDRGDGGGFAQGNADAIYRHREFIRDFDPDILLVLSSDHIYKLDYRDVIDRHIEREADVTIVTTRVPLEEASRFGTVEVGDDGRITNFAYKPDEPESDIVTTEVFVYDARTLLDKLETLAGEGAGEDADGGKGDNKSGEDGESNGDDNPRLKDYGHELLPALVGDGRAFDYPLEGYWRDVGTVESYWQSHMDLLDAEPALALDDPDWPILTFGTQLLPARIHASARVENSLISPGCTVRGHVVNSVLAPGVVVAEGATVRDSILLHKVSVEKNATVDVAVLDAQVRVGAGASVGKKKRGGGAKKKPRLTDKDITLVGQRVSIPARARVAAGGRRKARRK